MRKKSACALVSNWNIFYLAWYWWELKPPWFPAPVLNNTKQVRVIQLCPLENTCYWKKSLWCSEKSLLIKTNSFLIKTPFSSFSLLFPPIQRHSVINSTQSQPVSHLSKYMHWNCSTQTLKTCNYPPLNPLLKVQPRFCQSDVSLFRSSSKKLSFALSTASSWGLLGGWWSTQTGF